LKALVRVSQGRDSDAYDLLTGVTPGQDLSVSYQTGLGIVNVRLGRLRAGIENLGNAVRLIRNSRGKRYLGDALVNLAWGNLVRGEYDNSLELLQEASDVFEGEAPAMVRKAVSQLRSI
jgi:hypothetical protein